MIEQAGNACALDGFQIVHDHGLAFGGEQLDQVALDQFAAVTAEQRLRAAVAGVDVAAGIEHDDTFGRGIEDRTKLLGVGMANRGGRVAGSGLCDDGRGRRERWRQDQGERGLVVPGNRIEPRVGRVRRLGGDLGRRDPHRRSGFRGARGAGDSGLDVKRVQAAGLLERIQAVMADRPEKCRVGIEQPVEAVDQDARGQEVEQGAVASAFAKRGRFG